MLGPVVAIAQSNQRYPRDVFWDKQTATLTMSVSGVHTGSGITKSWARSRSLDSNGVYITPTNDTFALKETRFLDDAGDVFGRFRLYPRPAASGASGTVSPGSLSIYFDVGPTIFTQEGPNSFTAHFIAVLSDSTTLEATQSGLTLDDLLNGFSESDSVAVSGGTDNVTFVWSLT